MPRLAAAVVLVVVAVLAAGQLRSELRRDRPVTSSTPAARTGDETSFALTAGAEACLDQVTFDRRSEVATFVVRGPAAGLGSLAVRAVAPSGYEARATVRGKWPAARRVDVLLEPTPAPELGAFCVANTGSEPVELGGTTNTRTGARPQVEIDGETVPGDITLALRAARPEPLADRFGETLQRASAFRPGGEGLLWVLVAAVVLGAPLGVAAALALAVRER